MSPGAHAHRETGPDDPQAVAERSAAAMWADDAASQALGMELHAVSPGRATITMTVRDDMVNGQGICHGGLVFALADSAFAFACNAHGRRAVAQTCDITFLAPAHLGDVLVAEAVERSRRGRTGVIDVTVRRDGEVVAEFRGRSRETGQTWG